MSQLFSLSGSAIYGIESPAAFGLSAPAQSSAIFLGCILPPSKPRALRLSSYLPMGITVPARTELRAKARTSLGRMYLNDRYGCCLPPGTLIHKADGSVIPVEDVRTGQYVQTAEGNTGLVTKTMVRYVNENLVRIVAWGHKHLRLTDEHPILTRRGYVPAGQLTETDWIAFPRRSPGARKQISISRLLGDTVLYGVAGHGNRRGFAASLVAQKKAVSAALASLPKVIQLTPGLGRLLGLFLAEGSTCRRVVCWTFSKNERNTLVQETVDLLQSELGLDCSISERQSVFEVRTCGKISCLLFRKMCGVGAAGKRLHPDLHDGPVDFLRAVFDGWMDGDGHARRGSRTGTTISHALALDMFNIAQTIGLSPTMAGRQPKPSLAPNGPGGKMIPVHASYCWDVSVLDTEKDRSRWSSQYPGVSWSKHTGKWSAWGRIDGKSKNLGSFDNEEKAANVASEFKRLHQGSGLARSDSQDAVVWRRVRRIEREPYSGYVYNFEVAGDNSYVAEGVGVHNCVISGKGHSLGVWSGNDATEIIAKDDEILALYNLLKAGPGDPGCVVTHVLDYYVQKGMTFGGKKRFIDGYVAVDNTNVELIKAAIYLFGPLTLAVHLPQAWTQNAVWDKTNSPFIGGHDVSAIDYQDDGLIISSWGRLYRMTWQALTSDRYVMECYALLSPDWYNGDKLTPYGFKTADLVEDLKKIGGGSIPDRDETAPDDGGDWSTIDIISWITTYLGKHPELLKWMKEIIMLLLSLGPRSAAEAVKHVEQFARSKADGR